MGPWPGRCSPMQVSPSAGLLGARPDLSPSTLQPLLVWRKESHLSLARGSSFPLDKSGRLQLVSDWGLLIGVNNKIIDKKTLSAYNVRILSMRVPVQRR